MRDRETPVWDIVTRVFHWSLVVVFCTAQLTAESGTQFMNMPGTSFSV